MEGQLWRMIVAVLTQLDKRRKRACERFSDEEIVRTFYWSVIHDRPVSWSCRRENWPIWRRRSPVPSNSTMSHRLRSASVRTLLDALERCVVRPSETNVYWMIDGKPLVISGCSKDRQAGYGRAVQSKAKGYKLHLLAALDGTIGDWRVAPMNKDERVMAARMLQTPGLHGYVTADSNFDSNYLHAICGSIGNLQLLTPRRYGPGKGTGRRKQARGRLRSIVLLEGLSRAFGQGLLEQRDEIERQFGNLTNWGGGLTHLPPWVRTHRRVRRWVQAKLVLNHLKRSQPKTTYAAS